MTLLETSLKNQVRNFGLTLTQVAEITGIRVQVLSPGLNGRIPLCIQDIDILRNLLSRVQNLIEIFKPIPLGLQDTRSLKFLLQRLDDGALDNILTDQGKEIAAELELLQQQPPRY